MPVFRISWENSNGSLLLGNAIFQSVDGVWMDGKKAAASIRMYRTVVGTGCMTRQDG
ncbi:hypothetical protein SAMN05216436_1237 [bacterium A37T11]|nr:hypothetical protein SAMN05216436_1237 [bacterium A37T11]